MKVLFFAQFLTLLSLVVAMNWLGKRDGTTTSTTSSSRSLSPTTIWVVVTTNGVVATVGSLYSQSFMTTYTATSSGIQAGSIGMGSLTASSGGFRSYSQTTVSNEGNGLVYSGALGVIAVVAGILM